jgi:hypothetical protein
MVMIIALLTLTKDLESIIKICILYIYFAYFSWRNSLLKTCLY